jgi:hypothetical protein
MNFETILKSQYFKDEIAHLLHEITLGHSKFVPKFIVPSYLIA